MSQHHSTITINVAGRGTPLKDGDGSKASVSSVGHMWFDLDDGQGRITGYGFAPDKQHHGDPFAPGDIYHDDTANYLEKAYSRTIEITPQQYVAIKAFGDHPPGFDHYNGLENSCVDFVWKALEVGGLNPRGYQGHVWPTWNIDDIKRIRNPLVSSAAARPANTAAGLQMAQYAVSPLKPLKDLLGNLQLRRPTAEQGVETSSELLRAPGAGRVAELEHAATHSTRLAQSLEAYSKATSRKAQLAHIDDVLSDWADTSDMKSLRGQAEDLKFRGVSVHHVLEGHAVGSDSYDECIRKLGVVERFKGFTYGGAQGQPRHVPLNPGSGNVTVKLGAKQIAEVEHNYAVLKANLYRHLLPQTRLKPYAELHSAAMADDPSPDVPKGLIEGVSRGHHRFGALEDRFSRAMAAHPDNGLTDLVEFIACLGGRGMRGPWRSIDFLFGAVNAQQNIGRFSADLVAWALRAAEMDNHEHSANLGLHLSQNHASSRRAGR